MSAFFLTRRSLDGYDRPSELVFDLLIDEVIVAAFTLLDFIQVAQANDLTLDGNNDTGEIEVVGMQKTIAFLLPQHPDTLGLFERSCV